MRGSSQASLEAVASGFDAVLRTAGAGAATLGEQLFSVVDALDGSGSLRRALSDPSRDGQAKAGLVSSLLGGKVDDRVVEVVSAAARARWSAEQDLVEAVEELAAEAVLASAENDGDLAQVEDDLFRFGHMLSGQRDLRRALTERGAGADERARLVRTLVEGKVEPATLQLLERAARAPRGRSITASISLLERLAARRRERLVASVTAATPLTGAQQERLTSILERAYGRTVQLKVSVDPEVIGGVRVEVGSEVVDATVLANLEDARRRLAG